MSAMRKYVRRIEKNIHYRGLGGCQINEDVRWGHRRVMAQHIPVQIDGKCRSVRTSYGIIKMFLEGLLTENMIKGLYGDLDPNGKAWHLSHRCGNWNCCDTSHMVVEAGPTNTGRNKCLAKCNRRKTVYARAVCTHQPPCLPDFQLEADELELRSRAIQT